MPRLAPAIAELARLVRERVDRAGVGEERERPVDGREAEALAPAAEPGVELLGGHVVALAHQLRGDDQPLTRGADAELGELLACSTLRFTLRCAHPAASVPPARSNENRSQIMPLGLEISTDWVDYGVHFFVDVCGALATLYAQRFCRHLWHQLAIWFTLAVFVTFTTVNLVG